MGLIILLFLTLNRTRGTTFLILKLQTNYKVCEEKLCGFFFFCDYMIYVLLPNETCYEWPCNGCFPKIHLRENV